MVLPSSPAISRFSLRGIGAMVFAGALLARLGALFRLAGSPFLDQNRGDSAYYLAWASRIAEGNWTDGRAFYGLPFYPWWLAGWKAALGDPVWPALIANALADAWIAFFILETVVHVVRKSESTWTDGLAKLAGVGAAMLWIAFPPAAALAASLMPNPLATLAFWVVVRRLLAPAPLASPAAALGWGCFVGLGAMLSANLLFLLPLLGAKILFFVGANPRNAWSGTILRWGLLASGVIIGAAPCWAHNYFVARDPVFLSAHSGVNFFIGNHDGANGYPRFPPGLRASQEGMLLDSISTAEAAAGRPLRRSEVSAYWSARAGAWISEHPAEWLQLLGRKARNYWSAFQYDDISVISPLREWGVVWPGPGFGWLVALGLPGLAWATRRSPAARWMLAAVGMHLVSLLPVFVTERYRLPAVPALCVGAGVGAAWLVHALNRRAWTALGGAAIATAAAGCLAFWPVKLPGLEALDDFNTARVLLEAGRSAEAYPRLVRAAAAGPDDPGVNFLFGNYWLQAHNFPEAKERYRRVLTREPTHAGAWNNAALIALEERNWLVAERFLLRALPGSPDSPKVWYLLARARLGAGNLPAAADAIRQALLARPAQPEFLALRAEIAAAAPSAP